MLLPLLLVAAQAADPAPPPSPVEADPNQIVIIGGRNPCQHWRGPLPRRAEGLRQTPRALRAGRDPVLQAGARQARRRPADPPDAGGSRPVRARRRPIAQGRFVLPMFTDDDWRLVSDQPEAAFRLSPRWCSARPRASATGGWATCSCTCRVSWQLARGETNGSWCPACSMPLAAAPAPASACTTGCPPPSCRPASRKARDPTWCRSPASPSACRCTISAMATRRG